MHMTDSFSLELSPGEKTLIMWDVEKRALALVKEAIEEKGEFGGYTFCAGIVGYTYPRRLWREAHSIGFYRTADRKWVGFTHSHNGAHSIAEESFERALREKKEEFAANGVTSTFLDNVGIYSYLT